MIRIHTPSAERIGDALSHVRWMEFLCEEHNCDACITGSFSPLVRKVLGYNYPFHFPDEAYGPFDAEYTLDMQVMFGLSGQVHMCQSFFCAAGKPLPEIPLTLDLRVEPSHLPPGVVISPYCRSNSYDNNKFWPHDRWISVVQSLREGGRIDRVYVVGASLDDDPAPYVAAGIEPVFDRSLAQVLQLLKHAPLVLTVDNGISHLAHYGGVESNVLLYPGCLPECWVRNPYAVTVRASMPIDIEPYKILQAARIVLGRPHDTCSL